MASHAARTVSPADAASLDDIVAELDDGGTLTFTPGRYKANLWIERSIRLVGAGREAVILDGGKERPVVSVTQPACEVTLSGMTLARGVGGAGVGGNLHVFAATRVEARDCDFVDGLAEAGGGVFLRGGHSVLSGCRLMRNSGRLAQALWIYLTAEAELDNCLVVENAGPGPAVTASWGAHLSLRRCTVLTRETAALRLVSTGADAPRVEASDCVLGDPPVEVLRGGQPEPRLLLRCCALSGVVGREGVVDDGGNVVGQLQLDAAWRPVSGSIAEGIGAEIA